MNPITLSPKETAENPASVNYSSPNRLVKTVELNSSQQEDSSNFISRAGKFYFLIICIILLAMGIAPAVSGATRYSVASDNWNAISTWSATLGGTAGASVPGSTDDVYIVGGYNVTLTANASCASITFNTTTASSLAINSNISLTVTGLLSVARVASGMNLVSVGAGTIIVGSIDFPSSSTILSGHQVTISTGTLTVNGNVLGTTNKPSGSIIFSGAGTLKLGDAMFTATDGTLTTFAGSTVEYNRTGAQTIGNFSYQNLTLAGTGAKIISNSKSVTVNGVLSIEGTANIPATGTLTYGAAATLQYNTTTARTAGREWIPTFVASGGVIIKNTGTITLNAAKTFTAAPLIINSGSTLDLSTFTLSGANSLNLQCGGLTSGSSITGTGLLSLGGNINVTNAGLGTFGATIAPPVDLIASRTATVADDGSSASDLTISGMINAPTYNFTKSGAGSLYLGSSPVTINNFSIAGGIFKTTSGTLSIKGTYSNAGTFTDNLGIIEFSGTSAQSIPANGFSTLINTLKINNSSGVTLNQALIVNNLDLTAGTLNLLSNNLTVNTLISNASSNSYVKTTGTGMLRKNVGNGATQVFPVGNSAYNSMSIRNNSGSADFFTVRVLDEVYSNGYSAPAITANRVIRTWDISKATANAGAGVNFVFNWNLGEAIGPFTPTLWHHNGIVWNKQTGTTTNTATSLTYTGYTGSFSPFAIIDPMYLLPVVFSGFKVEKFGKTSLIKWNTSQEQNSKDFIIQHSLNGNDWTNIATLPAAGYSTSNRSYSYVHSTPSSGKNLYRIVQRDLDGKLTYTTILYISFSQDGNQFTVLTNPVQHGQLKVNAPSNGLMKLYNSQGQVLKSIPVTTGMQVIDLVTFPAGMYYIEAGNQTRTIILK